MSTGKELQDQGIKLYNQQDYEAAARLFVTLPEAFEAGQVIEQARRANPAIEIIARAHSEADVQHFTGLGATLTVMGEREIARRMLEHAVRRRG